MSRIPLFIAMIPILKVKRPEVFDGLREKKVSLKELENILRLDESDPKRHCHSVMRAYLQFCLMSHEEYEELPEGHDAGRCNDICIRYGIESSDIIPWFCKQFESFNVIE